MSLAGAFLSDAIEDSKLLSAAFAAAAAAASAAARRTIKGAGPAAEAPTYGFPMG
jgi:hypothetical protein